MSAAVCTPPCGAEIEAPSIFAPWTAADMISMDDVVACSRLDLAAASEVALDAVDEAGASLCASLCVGDVLTASAASPVGLAPVGIEFRLEKR